MCFDASHDGSRPFCPGLSSVVGWFSWMLLDLAAYFFCSFLAFLPVFSGAPFLPSVAWGQSSLWWMMCFHWVVREVTWALPTIRSLKIAEAGEDSVTERHSSSCWKNYGRNTSQILLQALKKGAQRGSLVLFVDPGSPVGAMSRDLVFLGPSLCCREWRAEGPRNRRCWLYGEEPL